MRRLVLSEALLMTLLAFCAAGKTLVELQGVYDRECQKLLAELADGKTLALRGYEQALATLKAKAQNAGDFDGTKAAMTEQERFALERTLPAGPVAGFAAGTPAGAAARQAILEVERRHAERMGSLSKQYVQALRVELADRLRQNKMSDAAEFDAEIKKIETDVPAAKTAPASGAAETRAGAAVTLPLPLKRGLVLYYGFDRDEGAVARDGGPLRNNGEVRGAAWTANGRVGGACEFGTDAAEVVSTRNIGIAGAAARTVAFWARMDALVGTWESQRLVGWGARGEGRQFHVGTSTKRWQVWGYGSNYDWGTGVAVDTSGWHHHVITHDDQGTTSWYIDGKLAAAAPRKRRTADSPVTIGGSRTRKAIDEVMIWNRSLSAAEVTQLYGVLAAFK